MDPKEFNPDAFDPVLTRVQEIMGKILRYQMEKTNGRAADLSELREQGILSEEDQEFLHANKIKYKPRATGSYRGMDMFEIPMVDGCIFTGPSGPAPPEHRIRIKELAARIEQYLNLNKPHEDLLPFSLNFSEHDGIGITHSFLDFYFRDEHYRSLIPAIKRICDEHGLTIYQDSPDIQGAYELDYLVHVSRADFAAICVDILRRACGLSDTDEISYVSVDLDELL